VWLCPDVGSAVNKYPPRQYVAARRDFPSERAGSDANASYRRPAQSKMRIQRPRARGYDSSCQKTEVIDHVLTYFEARKCMAIKLQLSVMEKKAQLSWRLVWHCTSFGNLSESVKF